jgi:hypothetical protein
MLVQKLCVMLPDGCAIQPRGTRQPARAELDRTWKTNFEDIMERRNVVKLLNSLDQCIEDAKLRKKRAEASANGGPVETPVP